MPDTAATYSVYLVRCADRSLYCGIARDVAARIIQHNESARGARYTRSRRPVALVYSAPCGTRSDAQKREHAIKKLSRAAKEQLIAAPRIAL
ncbi:MAG: GIY-YIG nuclease family protein [Hyphomicrobiaceae bacterium]